MSKPPADGERQVTREEVRDAMQTVQLRLDQLDRIVRQKALGIEADVRRRRPA